MAIRRIDDLGRLQLPKDYRKTLDIYEGDELVIELKDGYMIITKYEVGTQKCWRKGGCPYNSNHGTNYMKCWQKGYSVEQCRKDWKDM